jgi:hypothetical protein
MGTSIARHLHQAAIIILRLADFPGLALLSTVLGVTCPGAALAVRWR